ncbi:MAG: Dyp-type peroxidase [Myxococcales bacterium]|nr:Dyp-type peroxidase [Myxococcales bacterium]
MAKTNRPLHQPGIAEDVPRVARYLRFRLLPGAAPGPALRRLAKETWDARAVLGIGSATVHALDAEIPGLGPFPAQEGRGVSFPSTPSALWLWVRGEDLGESLLRTRQYQDLLGDAYAIESVVDAFRHRDSRDLTGYEDGTENPQGQDADRAAFVRGQGVGMDGSSFVAVQTWVHDLARFSAKSALDRDHTIGRRASDNEEIADAPASAHVKRTAQEDFEPAAFVLRRSMPWCDNLTEGLVFVAFGHSVTAFEALSHRMLGLDDGVVDALFSFTRPISGNYFWCPPMAGDHLDLTRLGL